mmetsp:Transcript_117684/g.340221  ORF Transcript_117684/g.340221 Transcript_117684/m.340221 type:complete len:82 (-) Transcript_117684:377-622(-)
MPFVQAALHDAQPGPFSKQRMPGSAQHFEDEQSSPALEQTGAWPGARRPSAVQFHGPLSAPTGSGPGTQVARHSAHAESLT